MGECGEHGQTCSGRRRHAPMPGSHQEQSADKRRWRREEGRHEARKSPQRPWAQTCDRCTAPGERRLPPPGQATPGATCRGRRLRQAWGYRLSERRCPVSERVGERPRGDGIPQPAAQEPACSRAAREPSQMREPALEGYTGRPGARRRGWGATLASPRCLRPDRTGSRQLGAESRMDADAIRRRAPQQAA